jgi:biopolymer transport protein ExbD
VQMKMKTIQIAILVLCASLSMGGEPDPRTFRVNVHTNGQYSIPTEEDSASVTQPQLATFLRHRYLRYGKHPIVIQSDQGVAFSNAWSVIEIAAAAAFWRQSILVEGHEVTVSVPARDFGPPKSPVILKGFKGNSPPDGVEFIRVTANAIQINGKEQKVADLAKHFSRIQKDASILVIATGDASMSSVGKVLKTVSDTGKTNLCLSKEIETAQQSPAGDSKTRADGAASGTPEE